jgi:hypothetical protein
LAVGSERGKACRDAIQAPKGIGGGHGIVPQELRRDWDQGQRVLKRGFHPISIEPRS